VISSCAALWAPMPGREGGGGGLDEVGDQRRELQDLLVQG